MAGSMKTVLDVTVCAHSRGGVGRWINGLSRGLSEISSEHISIDIPETHPDTVCPVSGVLSVPPPLWMKIPFFRRFMIGSGKLEASREGRIAGAAGVPDVIHLSGVQPIGQGRRKVVTFYDDTPWTDPGSHTEETLFYAANLAQLVRNGAAVLAISRWAAERAVATLGVSEGLTGVAGGAAEDIFTPGEPDIDFLCSLGIEPEKYFLHVGSFVPRKNIPFLLRCFAAADLSGKKLVLAGAERWGMNIYSELPANVVVAENVPDQGLLSLYRGAEAVLVPSKEEGLGLPVLEAFACGIPVISSDGGALPETVGEHGKVLPVSSETDWIEAIREGASSEMKAMAEEAERPTWRTVAENAMQFYRSLI
ncbi:hypothetical protein CSA37_05060 [Candidatus Fermentibacteria bacterium]|nr:MAG: hypothetical protein CSA37_10350 [Candidatus Fermentibacteria bacterium]PIE52298.1 MAG: hypothetical protein CSA37_07455 [Candidatus Fermentibacteria bacterium]PIE52793.1 MAG: hypothetical protein CSA37_05060 [Candidatus Fermentibacteria bacterium]